MIDCPAQYQLDSAGEFLHLLLTEAIARGSRVNPAVEERFVGVYVADAGENALIEQGSLDGPAGFGEPLVEVVTPNLQRLRSKPTLAAFAIAQPPQPAKSARVAKSQLPRLL